MLFGIKQRCINMKKNMLGLGYEELLQPDSASKRKKPQQVAVDMEKIKAAQKKFFGLDKMSQNTK